MASLVESEIRKIDRMDISLSVIYKYYTLLEFKSRDDVVVYPHWNYGVKQWWFNDAKEAHEFALMKDKETENET